MSDLLQPPVTGTVTASGAQMPVKAAAKPSALGPAHAKSTADAARLAQEFEGIFAGQVAKIMLETAETRGDFTGGAGESMFRGLLAEQIGDQIARTSGLGIASAVEAQIIRLQEGQ